MRIVSVWQMTYLCTRLDPVGVLVPWRTENHWRPRFIDQNGIHFIHNAVVQRA